MGKWNRASTRAELSRVRLAHIAKLLLCFGAREGSKMQSAHECKLASIGYRERPVQDERTSPPLLRRRDLLTGTARCRRRCPAHSYPIIDSSPIEESKGRWERGIRTRLRGIGRAAADGYRARGLGRASPGVAIGSGSAGVGGRRAAGGVPRPG